MLVTKNLIISILVVFLAGTGPSEAAAGRSKKTRPLTDGFVLAGINGKLTVHDANNGWSFEFNSDVSDGTGGLIRAGQKLELLPSSSLEKMAADVEKRSSAGYRLWATVTKYNGRNFLFAVYFLPLSKSSEPAPSSRQEPQPQQTEMSVNEPNDVLAIPQEITARLAAGKTGRPERLSKGLKLKKNFILVDRTAFLVGQTNGGAVLVLDALGRDIQQISFRALPCRVLERAQQKQSEQFEPLRFKIAGIVTRYKGERYLLLQRAARMYSHGNFDY
jgi:hypothetical protein